VGWLTVDGDLALLTGSHTGTGRSQSQVEVGVLDRPRAHVEARSLTNSVVARAQWGHARSAPASHMAQFGDHVGVGVAGVSVISGTGLAYQ